MPLHGRDAELKALAALVDGPADQAGVLVEGPPGIGKSALVAETVAAASVAGLRVLRTTAVEAERHLPYAGLHQLLHPMRAGLDGPLRAAFGLVDAPEPSPFLVGMAALTLLTTTPLLVVAEDVHWLDRASADVLAFVARRIGSDPVVLVATVRDGHPSPLRDAGLTPVVLEGLATDDAADLLDSVAPHLSAAARSRVLALAAGNPLALTELPAHPGDDGVLPLVDRLEHAFTARVAALPPSTRAALLVAAVNEGGSLAETLAAANAGPDVLTPAVDAGLIDLGFDAVVFRHPLMGSALQTAVSLADRGRAHLALADTLRDQPDRRAWHRASATAGVDERVAADLEDAADRAVRRGGADAGIAALEQAARLSEDDGRRADRLLRAAGLAVDAGRPDTAERLVRAVRTLDLSPRRSATASRLLSGFTDGVREDVSRVAELAALAGSVAAAGQVDEAARILWGAAMRCFWTEPGPAARRALLAVADGLPLPAGDPRLVAITAYVAPIERGAVVLAGLRALAGTTGVDPEVDRYLGSAALQVGAFDLAARFSAAAAPGLRARGQLGLLARALAVQAWSRVRLGDLAGAAPVAAEAVALAHETGQPFMGGLATATQAAIAALRGDHRQAARLADDAERVGLAAGARPVLVTVRLARGISALGEGRFDDAVADLSRVLDPADPSFHVAFRGYFVAELAEAVVRSGRTDALRDVVRDLESIAALTPSPALHSGLRYARAVLDPSDELFTAALDGGPAERGRVHLAFGEWLRRQRRVVESRTHLRAAREAFDALGLTTWAERARAELRGAGESSPNRGPDARDRLTPHELGIATLAAEGLTNREIGQRLFLSHRTVSTHLHRIFPKLGVSSRAELAAALA
ncbi:AAA family ATPase [Umezawaea sp. NPDC059074]|uniref:helix-turn-helix transcriptional regulator n=1 Tax=Umezawaea sp. NPDC059074 TaxID=3346716 RepID=UPI0036AD15B3